MTIADALITAGRCYQRHSPIGLAKWRVARALERLAVARPGQRTISVDGGFRMELDSSDFIQRTIYVSGSYEPHICAAMRAALKPGDRFLDVGANCGYLSLYAAKIVGPSGRVLAFEPNPAMRDALARNAALNCLADRVEILGVGLSDAPASAALHLTRGNTGAGSLRPADGTDAVPIELETYDRLAAANGWPAPDLVKIDVEGAEVRALRGMAGLLSCSSRPRRLLCEVSEWSLRALGSSKDELFDLMAGHGYRPRIISPIRQSIFQTGGIFFQYDVDFSA